MGLLSFAPLVGIGHARADCALGSDYTEAAPGIRSYDCTDMSPPVRVVTVDRSLPDVELRILATPQNPTPTGDPAADRQYQLRPLRDLAIESGALVAINGFFWSGHEGWNCEGGGCLGVPDTTVYLNGKRRGGLKEDFPNETLMGFGRGGPQPAGIPVKRISGLGKQEGESSADYELRQDEALASAESAPYRAFMYGGTRLVADGSFIEQPDIDFWKTGNPSVFGYSKEHIVFLTAEGLVQKSELEQTLKNFKVTDAIGNDGGPSSGLTVGGKVNKEFSARRDGKPRAIAYGIGLVPIGPKYSCVLVRDASATPFGELCVVPDSKGYDAQLTIRAVDPSRCGTFDFNLVSKDGERVGSQGPFQACTTGPEVFTYHFETGTMGGCATLHMYQRSGDSFGATEWSVPACQGPDLEPPNPGTPTRPNQPPRVSIDGPSPWQLFTAREAVTLRAAISDDAGDRHTCSVDWDDGTREQSAANGAGCALTHTFAAAGMYTIAVRVRDQDGAEAAAEVMVVVHDPNGGWANVDGSLASVKGSLKDAPELEGELWTHLTGRYYNGEPKLVGVSRSWIAQTDFRLEPRSLDWMVVTPDGKTAARGTGTLAGAPDYGFLVYGYDGCEASPAAHCQPGVDRARVVVWPLSSGAYPSGTLRYDSAAGTSFDVDRTPLTPLRSGAVLLQRP